MHFKGMSAEFNSLDINTLYLIHTVSEVLTFLYTCFVMI